RARLLRPADRRRTGQAAQRRLHSCGQHPPAVPRALRRRGDQPARRLAEPPARRAAWRRLHGRVADSGPRFARRPWDRDAPSGPGRGPWITQCLTSQPNLRYDGCKLNHYETETPLSTTAPSLAAIPAGTYNVDP